MTEKPLLSVIINCYNGEKYLREAIDSVLAQTYKNWEIVFWDNQSTDSTREIVKSYKDPRIHYFYAPKHTPLGEARNLAVEKTNGEYINFLDADDVWSENKLAEQVKLIDPVKVGVVFTPLCIILEKEQKLYKKMYRYFLYLEKYSYENNDVLHKVLDKGNFMVFSSIMFNKEIYKNVGGINPAFQQNEDLDIIVKAGLITGIANANKAKTYYRIHSNNNSKHGCETNFSETKEILGILPENRFIRLLKKENSTREVLLLLKNKKFKEAYSLYQREGDIIALFSIIKKKIVREYEVLFI